MFELLSTFFDGATRPDFEADLDEKRWVVLLSDRTSGELQGFSTLMLLEVEVEGEVIQAVFSGDTIVHRDFWGEAELASVWGRFVFSLTEFMPGRRLFWFLISKGYRTYKFLPVYFNSFYPRHDVPTPKFEAALMRALAERKYPGHYNPEKGILHFAGGKDRLVPDLAEVSESRLRDPHIRFFQERNPGYVNGDELVCLAELSAANLRPIAHRILARKSSGEEGS
ncbi:MAG: hypothetical protein VKP72_12625 [bacterium]|nr:hypothetical protein [bacterium]